MSNSSDPHSEFGRRSWSAIAGLVVLAFVVAALPTAAVLGRDQVADQNASTVADPSPTLVTFPGRNLSGFLWKPEGNGPFPTVLYNHGSEQRPGWKPTIGPFLVQHGYALFVPHRHGHGQSRGVYSDWMVSVPYIPDQFSVDFHEWEMLDQLAGLRYLRSLPFVDTDRVAVMGCSFGGIQTIFGAAQAENVGYRAAVAFSPGPQSWDNEVLKSAILHRAAHITVPTFLLQAENDFTTEPSEQIASVLEQAGTPHWKKIYSAFGNSAEMGHTNFCEDAVDIWGPDVLDFLGQFMPVSRGK
jgi:carboxymethylenebutenolidase